MTIRTNPAVVKATENEKAPINNPVTIGPNATLVFDVELLEIKKPSASVTTDPVSAPSAK